eukprot:Opistho-2@1102
MPAYHSNYNELTDVRLLGNMSLLPIKSQFKGPAPSAPRDSKDPDIVDEALLYFKANVFFKNFDIKGPADRVLVYLTLFTSEALGRLVKCNTKNEGLKAMNSLALENFAIPGDKNFPINSLYSSPTDRAQADTMRQYFLQLRQELGVRLVDLVLAGDKQNKWWTCFVKRRFMNKSLDGK